MATPMGNAEAYLIAQVVSNKFVRARVELELSRLVVSDIFGELF